LVVLVDQKHSLLEVGSLAFFEWSQTQN